MTAWRGRRVLVTAGPTREPLDPVRFLTNASSGRMGYALAAAARRRGARVTLVSGPTALPPPRGVSFIRVLTARDMLRACLRSFPGTDLVVGAAAVGDWRPAARAARKIKKAPGRRSLTVRFIPNPDVLKTLSGKKRGPRPVMAGFALETENVLGNARRKLASKGLDLIVANGASALDGEKTRAWILSRDGKTVPFAGTKNALAEKILTTAGGFL